MKVEGRFRLRHIERLLTIDDRRFLPTSLRVVSLPLPHQKRGGLSLSVVTSAMVPSLIPSGLSLRRTSGPPAVRLRTAILVATFAPQGYNEFDRHTSELNILLLEDVL